MDLGLQGKVALVLAASKGIGQACADALAAEGALVAMASRDQETLERSAQAIADVRGVAVLAIPADVTNVEDLERLVDATIQQFGRIDILVNNAGGPPGGTFEDFADAQWLAAFELNLLSVVRTIRLVLPHMRTAGGGRIINIVSTSVKQPIDNLLLSNAIRPGVIGLAKSLSIELGPENITVNNVCPGRIETDRLLGGPVVAQQLASGVGLEKILENIAQDIPLRRVGKPKELAALVAFLASEQAAYITGTTIQVDGGLVRSIL